ncbi:MAG: hypothetical protein E7J62_05750 [Serratia marcescens]|jgi:hypothetical protein|nr:hypothetical protein [Serratia marcescens]
MKNKSTNSQIKASRNWEKKNRKKATVDSYRRTAKLYIKDYATKEDMQEFNKIFEDKLNVQ